MNYSTLLVTSFAVFLFLSCSKKDLPAPDPLNASNTNIYQQGGGPTQSLTAPCATSLQSNKISYTYSPSGNTMYFTPQASEFMGFLTIRCSDYSTYNNIRITLPYRYSFVGKLKYDVNPTNSSQAQFLHTYDWYYGSMDYQGYEGSIYVEYTSTQIILSFCDVKVKDGVNNIHAVTGQIVFANNF